MTDLTTIAAVKSYIGKADMTDDIPLQQLVTAYSQFVRSWTNRDFSVQSYDLWRSGRGNALIMTPQWPITGVTSISVDGQAIAAATSWDGYGYRFTDRAVVLSGGASFTPGGSNVHIVYTAGYASIPVDIAQAVNELVALRYRLKDKLEWSSKSLAGETVSLITRDMPAAVATVLRQYLNPVPL